MEVAVSVKNQKTVEQTVDDLHDWVDELHVKLLDAKANTERTEKKLRSEKTKLDKLNTVTLQRLELLKNVKVRLK